MPRRHYFTDEKTTTLDTSTEGLVKFSRVGEGKEYHYTNISAVNNTTSGYTLKFGILKIEQKIWLEEETNCTKGVTYSNEKEIVVTATNQLIVGFFGGGSSDKVEVRVNGYWVKVGEE